MSSPIAVCHGAFGRVCLYAMDRAMAVHAHREGHLIFHVEGPPAEVVVDGRAWPLSAGQAVAVSPFQAHFYRPVVPRTPVVALVLYIKPGWFVENARRASGSLRFGRVGIEVIDYFARLVVETFHSMLDPERDDPALPDRLCTLTQAAFDQSWQWTDRGSMFTGARQVRRDFRIRKALGLIQDWLCDFPGLDAVAREVGLSRPHFFKLFHEQVGVTPAIYLNSLRMEEAIERLACTPHPVTEISFDLGFSSQASFSRFFIANGVVAPSAYRRIVQVAGAR
jgi:AraC-like DNA-binding protein